MNKWLVTFMIALPFAIHAQTESDIIGTWKAIDGKQTSSNEVPPGNQLMTLMIDTFKGSTWTFNGAILSEFNSKRIYTR